MARASFDRNDRALYADITAPVQWALEGLVPNRRFLGERFLGGQKMQAAKTTPVVASRPRAIRANFMIDPPI
jgi:hypothetical protein